MIALRLAVPPMVLGGPAPVMGPDSPDFGAPTRWTEPGSQYPLYYEAMRLSDGGCTLNQRDQWVAIEGIANACTQQGHHDRAVPWPHRRAQQWAGNQPAAPARCVERSATDPDLATLRADPRHAVLIFGGH